MLIKYLCPYGIFAPKSKIMAKLTVYGTPLSTYVRTVRLLLEEASVDYTLKEIDIFTGENQSPEYLAKNPFGKVPTLEVEAEVIYETPAITDYLNTIFANQQFSPSEPLLQARMRQIITIIDNYFYPSAIGTIVIQRLIVPIQGGQPDEDKIQNAVAPAQKAIQAIEAIAVGSPYLLGSQVSIADFYLIPIFIYLAQTPEYEVITAQTPKLRTWWEQAQQLESVKKVCA
ncbi:Glutathione S-transferase domain protein [Nostoc sp. PCC 7107]|nr:Glutathione S-transferase domain protein [Nostoc sp. PCC 7107]